MTRPLVRTLFLAAGLIGAAIYHARLPAPEGPVFAVFHLLVSGLLADHFSNRIPT